MAPSIVIGADDYAALRLKERAIMSAALQHFRVRSMSSNDFSWADQIAELLGSHPGTPTTATMRR
jgi:hypothetical protein